MSTKVASLYAEIGANVTPFEKGARKVKSGLTELQRSMSSFLPAGAGGFITLGSAITSVGVALKTTLDESIKYANQVREISMLSGQSAEDSSRFIQVLDDYKISAQDATAATKALTKEGLTPSTDTLAKLSDQYLALNTAQERNEFVLKNLGRNGLQWVEILGKGSKAIREQAAAVDDSLILTEKAVKQAREYELAMDDLSDSAQALKIEIGGELIPVLTRLVDWTNANILVAREFYKVLTGEQTLQEYNEAAKGIIEEYGYMATGLGKVAKEQEEFNQQQEMGVGATESQAEAVKAASAALDNYKDAIDRVSESNKDALDLTFRVSDAQRDYEKAHLEAAKALQEARAGGDNEEINAAIQGIQELEAEWHKSTESMIYDMVQAQVAVDGLTNAEFDALQDLAVQKGLITDADAERAKALRDEADAIANGIAQQEDVLSENMAINERIAQLEGEKAAAADGVTVAVNNTNSAMIQVVGSTQAATQAMAQLQQQAQAAAQAAASFKMPSVGSSNPMIPGLKSIGGKAGGFKGVSSRDSGGDGKAGEAYIIGKGAQPEMFIPNTNGTFVPNADKIGGKTINIVVNNPQPKSTEDSVRNELKTLSYSGYA